MRTKMAALAVLALAAASAAQEKQLEGSTAAPAVEAQATEASRDTPRPAIRVLQHPYDISSFYRSGESPLGPWAGLPNDPAYGIAGFYRAHEGGYPGTPHGWSAFWTNGYRAPRPVPFRPYRRTIGENGDLFLAVPFLAPIGPISGAFSRLLSPEASRTERPVWRRNRSAMPSRPLTVSSFSTRSTRFIG